MRARPPPRPPPLSGQRWLARLPARLLALHAAPPAPPPPAAASRKACALGCRFSAAMSAGVCPAVSLACASTIRQACQRSFPFQPCAAGDSNLLFRFLPSAIRPSAWLYKGAAPIRGSIQATGSKGIRYRAHRPPVK